MKEYFNKFMNVIYELYNISNSKESVELNFLFEGRTEKRI